MSACQKIAALNWVLMIEGLIAIPRQSFIYTVSCNVTCSTSTCDCELDGTIYCDGRNLAAIPSVPECSRIIFLQNNEIAEIGEKEEILYSILLYCFAAEMTLVGCEVDISCVALGLSRLKSVLLTRAFVLSVTAA